MEIEKEFERAVDKFLATEPPPDATRTERIRAIYDRRIRTIYDGTLTRDQMIVILHEAAGFVVCNCRAGCVGGCTSAKLARVITVLALEASLDHERRRLAKGMRGHIDTDCEALRGVGAQCTCRSLEEQAEDARRQAENDAETARLAARPAAPVGFTPEDGGKRFRLRASGRVGRLEAYPLHDPSGANKGQGVLWFEEWAPRWLYVSRNEVEPVECGEDDA